jgi:hypothetical protein
MSTFAGFKFVDHPKPCSSIGAASGSDQLTWDLGTVHLPNVCPPAVILVSSSFIAYV